MRLSVIAVVVGCLAGVATAQPSAKAAQSAFVEGQQRYTAGDYLVAAAKFETAYAFDPDPVYLFNVAQAYRLGNACAKAVSFYRRFLAAVPNPPNLAKVNQYLAQAETCAKAAELAVPAAPIEPTIGPATTVPRTDEDARPEDPGRTKRWLGLGAVFVGGAAIGVGVYYATEARRLTQDRLDLRNMCPATGCVAGYGDALDAEGESAQLRARVSLAVGGAALIGGVVLYVLNRDSERASIAVVPTPGGAYAVGAFAF